LTLAAFVIAFRRVLEFVLFLGVGVWCLFVHIGCCGVSCGGILVRALVFFCKSVVFGQFTPCQILRSGCSTHNTSCCFLRSV